MYDLLIIGGGAAGLMAAAGAAELGQKVLLLEKNKQTGVKILMSGGTRCNITHATDQAGIAAAFATFDKKQAQFLRSALAALPPERVIEIIEAEGVTTKVEDTGKIFPVSNKAIHVRDALQKHALDRGVELRLNFSVDDIQKQDDGFVVRAADQIARGKRLLLTSGGQSYPGCGTTGDGYGWARQFGHRIVNPVPALTPLTTDEKWIHDLKGITVQDASISIVRNDANRSAGDYGAKQFLDTRRSSLLFTHFGFSGPSSLDISRIITRDDDRKQMNVICDFLPHIKFEPFVVELTATLHTERSKQIGKIIPQWVPRRLAEAVIERAGITLDQRAAEISKKQIRALALQLKACLVPLNGTLGFKKAEVTSGGVHLSEVDSKTMQSKLVEGLFFAGEILDIDGPIGGFNFQAAFSTGWLAGQSAC